MLIRQSIALFAALAFVVVPGAMARAADSHEGIVVSVQEPTATTDGKLVMTDRNGKGEHSHAISSKAKITRKDKTVKLSELKKGDAIKVTTNDDGKVTAVTTTEKGASSVGTEKENELPDFLSNLNLSNEQKDKIKAICHECNSERETAWKEFSQSYRVAIGMEASMLAAIEDHLSDAQRKHIRAHRRRMSHHHDHGSAADANTSSSAKNDTSRTQDKARTTEKDRGTDKDTAAEVDEIVIIGVTLSPDQETAAEKVRESFLDQLGELNARIEELHSRLVALETERLLQIEDILTKEQREQLRKDHKQLGRAMKISSGAGSSAR